jgi:hypothetical protein
VKLLASLDPRDRSMLLVCFALVAVLLAVLVVLTPASDADNPLPGSYRTGVHGAKAAYTLLEQTGYTIERWQQPLAELADRATSDTVLITAEPYSADQADRDAIAAILNKGGRVVATGSQGGALLPESKVTASKAVDFAACEAQPDGLQPLAGKGSIWIVPMATWMESRPQVRTAYTCAGEPVVVEYPYGRGTAVWWASATPLENGSIARGQDMELLLNSVGSSAGHHIYWDESLHANRRTQWDFVRGPIWPLLFWGLIGLALLTLFSFSRRSGPLRSLPAPPRITPLEFLEALGALYRSTRAANTALQIALERFRAQAGLLTGRQTAKLNAGELAAVLQRRFGAAAAGIEADLTEAEEACWNDQLRPRKALELIQTLRRQEEKLRQAIAHR